MAGRIGPEAVVAGIAAVIESVAVECPLSEMNENLAIAASCFLAQANGMRFSASVDDATFRKEYVRAGQETSSAKRLAEWVRLHVTQEAGRASLFVEPSPRLPLLGLDPESDEGARLSNAEEVLREPAAWSEDWPADTTDGLRAYLASPLTGLDEDGLHELQTLCDEIAKVLSNEGIAVHQPVLHSNPQIHKAYSPREIHVMDVGKTMNADFLIAICAPSLGAGKELAYVERYRTPQLLLVPEGDVLSRLPAGTTADVEVHFFNDAPHAAQIVTDYVHRKTRALDRHRTARVARETRWAPLLGRLRAAVVDLGEPTRRADVTEEVLLTPDRVEEILSSPGHLAGASLDEIDSLASLLGIPDFATAAVMLGPGRPSAQDHRGPDRSRHLTDREFVALQAAAELSGWDGPTTVAIVRQAESILSQGGARRLRFLSIEDWIGFHEGGSSR
ncbi:MAG: hypothetical protein M3256_14770 [Actinomycetota bacterium]|nr:hypothetical protein [Actinomycetota bacterium]